jgi:type II secretory pathway pseudopilin PulG
LLITDNCVMGTWIKIAAVVVVAVLAAGVFVGWRDARKEQAALQRELKTTQQALAEATARQASRDEAVNDLVAGLKKKEAAVQKPAQVVAALPDVITLPAPITIEAERPASPPSSGQAEGGPHTGKSVTSDVDGVQPKVNFPAADLKPLYDFAADCKACQAKLGAAQADLADEKVKSQALGRERDDALRAAKGGSVLRRIARAAKWFAIGAAAGAIAAKVTR